MAQSKTSKIYNFNWKAKNQQGASLEGEMKGSSMVLVKMDLKRQGLTSIKVTKELHPFFKKAHKKITAQDIALFVRQLSTMLSSGIPLVQAIDIVSKGLTNNSMQKLLITLKTDLEAGNSLAESLKKHPKHFDLLFYHLVNAGEQSGTLDDMLNRIATYKEKMETLKAKIKKALMYPMVVILIALVVSAALLIFVVPEFQTIFQGAGVDLPVLTRMVISLSKWVQSYWWFALFMIAGGVFLFNLAYEKFEGFAFFVDKWMLSFPIIGEILRKAIISRFASTLATTFAAGMPLVDALNTVAGTSGNRLYSKALLKVREEVATGQQLNISMLHTGLFPSMVIQMTAVGEESGALEKMLAKVAEFYQEQVDNTVDTLSSLIEPIIIVVLGIIIGTLVVAMYLPIFKLGTAI